MSPNPRLSVVIVNYNVKYFLEQCLHAALKAGEHVPIEIFVVDNASSDGSLAMMRHKFPDVQLIANRDNVGFSKANNQAMRLAKGDYVLLLNPDTLVEEDTFSKCVDFMDNHPDAGGLGVKMVDGKGRFLPESKRGLPTPMVAFYKIFGLSTLFPKSKRFGGYHLGYLDENKTHAIDILAGAFMMMRKTVLEKVGLLDEAFFMYGEDIDLSWRIRLAGYKNYYFPETRIIHYKGESTKKSSVNYVMVFYNAMIIFARKHFSKSNASIFAFLIKLAIYFRAAIALMRRIIEKSLFPAIDAFLILLGLGATTIAYSQFSGIEYPVSLLSWLFPSYAIIVLTSLWYHGAYDKPVYAFNVLKGAGFGLTAVFIIYAFLPEHIRFSRAIMLLASLIILFLIISFRWILHITGYKFITFDKEDTKRTAILGNPAGISRVKTLLRNTTLQPKVLLEVYPEFPVKNNTDHFVAGLDQLPEAIELFKINEVIYCAEDISPEQIINEMIRLDNPQLEFKIAPPESSFIIGSQSISTTGELFNIGNFNKLNLAQNRRDKRLFDFGMAFLLLLASPVLLFFVQSKLSFIKACFEVLFRYKTWVGFEPIENQEEVLPQIGPSVLTLGCPYHYAEKSELFFNNLNQTYAKRYSISMDLKVILHCWKNIGR